MSKEKEFKHKKTCNCSDDCDCGCNEGKECTCNDEKCSCDDKCDCDCHNHENNCECEDHCTCGCNDNCTCDDKCDCGCHEEHCDCGCEDNLEGNEEYKKYEKAFIQLENALIKVDKELEETKKRADENEHLAVTIKKDFERFKTRTKEEEEKVKVNAVINVADKLIPILDNFDQALKLVSDDNVSKGFEMIQKQLQNAIFGLGIEEIEAVGKEFDPKLHNAVSKRKTNDKKLDNTVASVYQKGYKMAGENGKVIRHSTVEIYLQD